MSEEDSPVKSAKIEEPEEEHLQESRDKSKK